MTWKTVYISGHAHLSCKNNWLIVRKNDVKQVHLSEIHTLIIDSNMTTMTAYLINELARLKVKLIVCDEKHNPSVEMVPYYGSHDTSEMIMNQFSWTSENCGLLWKQIVQYKIKYQSMILKKFGHKEYNKLDSYIKEVEFDDSSNREGHAAKVYFNALFGKEFCRKEDNEINAFLNYGYSLLLSTLNKEVVSCGYITQIGIHHRGPKNPFNLSCDLMEPFRPIIDGMAVEYFSEFDSFDNSAKIQLLSVIDKQFVYDGRVQYLTNLIRIYVSNVLGNLNLGVLDSSVFEYEEY